MESLGLVLSLVIFALSLFGLIKGADVLVDGASGIARRFGISELIVGLTIIAFGTSLPELVVSLHAALQQKGAMALSNVLGSNITNILLVLGATAAISPLSTPRSLKNDLPFSLVLAIAFMAMIAISADIFVVEHLSQTKANLDRFGGAMLLGFFLAFMMQIRKAHTRDTAERHQSTSTSTPMEPGSSEPIEDSPTRVWLFVFVGLVLIILGGQFTVDSAINIARHLSVPESTIGLTIVAFGTSLPELVASLTAAKKGLGDMAIGNVIGSNIMNLTLVLGTAAIIKPIDINVFEAVDVTTMTITTLLLIGLLHRSKVPQISRSLGILSVGGYLIYMASVALRA